MTSLAALSQELGEEKNLHLDALLPCRCTLPNRESPELCAQNTKSGVEEEDRGAKVLRIDVHRAKDRAVAGVDFSLRASGKTPENDLSEGPHCEEEPVPLPSGPKPPFLSPNNRGRLNVACGNNCMFLPRPK